MSQLVDLTLRSALGGKREAPKAAAAQVAGQVKPAGTLGEALREWRALEAAVLREVAAELEGAGARLDAGQLRWAEAEVRARLLAGVEARG